jgi:hypothetical protein
MISKFKPFLGPQQHVFKDPDTGIEYSEKDKKTLINRIVAYRRQNELPEIEFLDDVLENYWCSLPENTGRCEHKALGIGILPIMKAGMIMLKNFLYDSVVGQDVAEKRAAQCVGCKFNRLPESSGVKSWLDLIAINSVKGHRTSQYEKLGTCSVCECPLNMKVFYNGKVDKPTIEQQKKFDEVTCWQLGLVK